MIAINHSRFFLILILLFNGSSLNAHALEENSAQIILREGQLEVHLLVDINRWQTLLQDHRAWLLGDTEQVMPTNLTAQEKQDFLKDILANNLKININQQEVALSIRTFPKNIDLHHDQHLKIIMLGQHSNSKIDTLTMRFPKSLGVVHSSVVQPKYRLIPAGESASVSF